MESDLMSNEPAIGSLVPALFVTVVHFKSHMNEIGSSSTSC